MIKTTIILAFCFAAATTFAQKTNPRNQTLEAPAPVLNEHFVKEERAIVELLEREAATWRSGDVAGHAACWQERPYSRVLVSTPDGKVVDVPVSVLINPPADLIGGGGHALLSNFKISISKKTAWVSHDEVSVAKDGTRTRSAEFRMLEKVGGRWKLVGQSIHIAK
jgi:TolB protein